MTIGGGATRALMLRLRGRRALRPRAEDAFGSSSIGAQTDSTATAAPAGGLR